MRESLSCQFSNQSNFTRAFRQFAGVAADIADRRQPEIALVHFGAHIDVFGLRLTEITPGLVADVLALYPRVGMKAAFAQALAEVARRKPHTAIGTGLADVARRLVPGLECPNVCDLIDQAPFES